MAAPPPKLFVKLKKKFAKGDDLVYSIFIFNDNQQIWNHLFQRDIMNRFNTPTNVYTTNGTAAAQRMYNVWAESEDEEDTLANSVLPYPNLNKGYVWKNNNITTKLHRKEKKRGKKRGRIDCRSLKKDMVIELLGEPFVMIEATERTLVSMMKFCTFNFRFKMNSILGATTINKLDYNRFIISNNLIGALRTFDITVFKNEEEGENVVEEGENVVSESDSSSSDSEC
jgi:hypothetical protein